jgi:hypothetical protein
MSAAAARSSTPSAKKKATTSGFTTSPAPVPAVAAEAVSPNKTSFVTFVKVWWPTFMAAGTCIPQLIMDPPVSSNEPMINMINLSKASRVLSDPMFYVMLVPFSIGCVGLKVFFSKVRVNAFDRGMMVWWHASCFFFYTHCDILSGYYGVMPGMAEQYIHSAPPLRYPRWAPERFHFDVVFFLDIILQCPLAIFVILSYLYQHPGRYFAEVFAAAAQLFGTALYYTPHILFPEENRDFLQWMDMSLRAVWFVYPLLILRRRFLQAEEEQRKKTP